ncbi:hypothetical protein CIPAW_11G020200 [Carya illinoinensis]|uniref:Uncharacterized protein n=1 Tax=Carya illinoinensis TaxID=32201 RepID=A0A8T1P1B6_CARIL|nr:hypothetical protein CIPAW_11G020200 [Carya illinoinensis]
MSRPVCCVYHGLLFMNFSLPLGFLLYSMRLVLFLPVVNLWLYRLNLEIHEALLKISEDIVSKVITGSVLDELADFISKMTKSYLNLDSQTTQSRADSTA